MLVFRIIIGILLFFSFTSAFSFEVMPEQRISTLDGVNTITAHEIYSEIHKDGTWHYYLYDGELTGAEVLTPKGFSVLEKKAIKGELILKDGVYSFIEGKGGQTVLAIKTTNWAQGSFNPDVSACGTLADANTLYTLNQSINSTGTTCLTVGAQNITIDCNGSNIVGTNQSSTYGIYSTQLNTNIRNCNISGYQHGIYFTATADNSTIFNTTAWTTTTAGNAIYLQCDYSNINQSFGNSTVASGIRVDTGGNNYMINSISQSNTYYSFYIYNSQNNVIKNHVSNSGTHNAIRMEQSRGTNISDSNFISASNIGITVFTNSNNTRITNSSAVSLSGSSTGIYITGSINVSVINSTATSVENYALRILSNSHNFIANGTTAFASGSRGFSIESGDNATIDCQGKNINGTNTTNQVGVVFSDFNGTVMNCNFTNMQQGIALTSGASNCTIKNNQVWHTFVSNGYGIYINGGANNTIQNNTPYSQSSSAIYILNGIDNRIYDNNATSGLSYALYLSGSNRTDIKNMTLTSTKSVGLGITNGYYNTAQNVSAISTTGAPIYLTRAVFNTLTNITAITASTVGGITAFYLNNASYNNLTNCILNSTDSVYALTTYANSSYNLVESCYIQSNTAQAIRLSQDSFYNSFNNLTIHSAVQDAYSVSISDFNNLSNSLLIGGASSDRAIRIEGVSFGNNFWNNTLTSQDSSANLLEISLGAYNNTFWWNNFTNTSGYYVYDLDGNNSYNMSWNGTNMGNIWFNVLNGSVLIWGNNTIAFDMLYVGLSGERHPYNNSNSYGKIFGGVDYAPLTTIGTIPYPTVFIFITPLNWTTTYYPTINDLLNITWNNSISPIGREINYSSWLYRDDGVLIGILDTNSTFNFSYVNRSNNSEFYFVLVRACDNFNNLCREQNSSVFGLYNTSLNITFGTLSASDGQIMFKNNFSEYCAYYFYPNKTQSISYATLTEAGDATNNHTAYTSVIMPNQTNAIYFFSGLPEATYKRVCHVQNIYNETGTSASKDVHIQGEQLSASDYIPPSSSLGGFGTSLLYLVFLGYVGLIVFRIFGEKKEKNEKQTEKVI